MRQLTIKISALFICLCLVPLLGAYASIKGGIQYSIPVYYENLSESELKEKADKYFDIALKLDDKTINEDMTNALIIFSVLHHVNPGNYVYPMKLGILYDKAGKDRHAKGAFFEAAGINPSAWEPYFYLGEFYYKRELYKPALKNYKKAYEKTSTPSNELLYRICDIYKKFGDEDNLLFYSSRVQSINNNP